MISIDELNYSPFNDEVVTFYSTMNNFPDAWKLDWKRLITHKDGMIYLRAIVQKDEQDFSLDEK